VLTGSTPEKQGIFEAREVTTGTVYERETEIRSGLTGRERLAKEAGYLTDSESFISTHD
jgi:hypothetical protein